MTKSYKCTTCGAIDSRVCNGDNHCCSECGDSEGLIEVYDDGPGIKISPSEKLAYYKKRYQDLIMAVKSKYEGETRHETALRYIRAAEEGNNQPMKEDK